MKRKILIIGSGGREHAIGRKLKQDSGAELFFSPGNGGTAEIGINIGIKVEEINKLADFAAESGIDLTVVGPELPLTLGIADEFNRRGLRVFGPGVEGARLEGSKAYAKQFMEKYKIPTAKYDTAATLCEGMKLLEQYSYPLVIKADGLAAGKGVMICAGKAEAEKALRDMMEREIFFKYNVTNPKFDCLIYEEVERVDFSSLYNAYADDVYSYIFSLCQNKHIAEDITSETFIKAIKAADKFKGDCNMRVWLCQIAKNTYYNLSKRSKFVADMPDDFPSEDNFELRLSDKTQAFEIHKVLRLLDEPYKEVFSLRIFAELSFAEIGKLFNKSESWARVTFHRAKNKIKEAIEHD